jgi:hypothetical protein
MRLSHSGRTVTEKEAALAEKERLAMNMQILHAII